METLLEDKDPEYRELFAPSLDKLTEMKSIGSLKAVHGQIGKAIGYITGEETVIPKKTVLIGLDEPQQKNSLLDFPLFSQPEEKQPETTSPTKPNAFTFMQTAEAKLPKEKPNLFANLNLKNPSPPPKTTAQSSFGFMNKEAEKKTGLQGIDFDFATTTASNPKPSDALVSLNFDVAFDPIEKPPFSSSQPFAPTPITQQIPSYGDSQAKPQMMGSQPFYATGVRPQGAQQYYTPTVRPQMISQPPLYTKGESETNSIDDKYFGFVNDEL